MYWTHSLNLIKLNTYRNHLLEKKNFYILNYFYNAFTFDQTALNTFFKLRFEQKFPTKFWGGKREFFKVQQNTLLKST